MFSTHKTASQYSTRRRSPGAIASHNELAGCLFSARAEVFATSVDGSPDGSSSQQQMHGTSCARGVCRLSSEGRTSPLPSGRLRPGVGCTRGRDGRRSHAGGTREESDVGRRHCEGAARAVSRVRRLESRGGSVQADGSTCYGPETVTPLERLVLGSSHWRKEAWAFMFRFSNAEVWPAL